jgi:hypothetical protein
MMRTVRRSHPEHFDKPLASLVVSLSNHPDMAQGASIVTVYRILAKTALMKEWL